jgi:hypothetical protein
MSALGQKQTCAVQLAMSALPLKVDIGGVGPDYLALDRRSHSARIISLP